MQTWLVSVLVLVLLSGCWWALHAQPPTPRPAVLQSPPEPSTPAPPTMTPPAPAAGIPDIVPSKARRSTTQVFSGTIVALNIPAQQLVVKNAQGLTQSFFLEPRTKFSQGKRKATLGEFSTGQQVRIRYRAGSNSLSIASSVRRVSHKTAGTRRAATRRRHKGVRVH